MNLSKFWLLLCLTALFGGAGVYGQGAITLSGVVTDENRAPVPQATVRAVNTDTNQAVTTTASGEGLYIFAEMRPGNYRIEFSSPGFKTLVKENVVLNVAARAREDARLEIGDVTATITVDDAGAVAERDSATVSTVVDREFVENIPLNGRSFQSLIELTPGVVLTPAQTTNPGQFSVNGQRTNSNYFMLDGVGANTGTTPIATSSQQSAGTLPGTTVVGGFNNLVSVDELQEFRIQTSSFAPEFGRTPGGQISLLTRSGDNRFSASAFNYLRNEIFDANSFFNNRAGIERGTLRQNNFGFTAGGPLPFLNFGEGVPVFSSGKDKTFFFVSYEGLIVRQPVFRSANVPSQIARDLAVSQGFAHIAAILDGFPKPNAAPTTTDPLIGRFEESLSNPVKLNSTGVRIDHNFNAKFSVFGRYKDTRSSNDQATTLFANQTNYYDIGSKLLTYGATFTPTSDIVVDLRGNYTDDLANYLFTGQDRGGAVLAPLSMLMPAYVGEGNASASVQLAGSNFINQTRGRSFGNGQQQTNLVGSLTYLIGKHELKIGGDYRRLAPRVLARSYGFTYNFTSLQAALIDPATRGQVRVSVQALAPAGAFKFENVSAFVQDTWRMNRNLTLTFGTRWDVNAPPSSTGDLPYTLTQVKDLMTAELAPAGTEAFNTTYANFAPRFGAAYSFGNGKTVIRGGIGIFNDIATGQATRGYTGFPFSSVTSPVLVPFVPGSPALEAALQPRAFNTAPPYSSTFYVYDRDIDLPYTIQYNAAIEHSLGSKQSISLTYVGSKGRRLLFTESLANAAAQTDANLVIPEKRVLNPIFGTSNVNITDNRGRSEYNSLQIQYNRRLSAGLQLLSSYTYAHSRDNISSEIAAAAAVFRVDPALEYGYSDFDIRHTFTAAATYNIPSPLGRGAGKAILGGFSVDLITRARSAPPYNAFVSFANSVAGTSYTVRPDRVDGVDLYIYDDSLPGGRKANPAAFAIAPVTRQGTLERNALRAFPLFQTDVALRRELKFAERLRVQLRAEAFNVFNQANFAVDSSNLFTRTRSSTAPTTNLTFGQANSVLANQLSGSGGVGFNSLYTTGGPRSMQFAIKLLF